MALGSLLFDQRCRVIHSIFVSPVPQFHCIVLGTNVEEFLSEMQNFRSMPINQSTQVANYLLRFFYGC